MATNAQDRSGREGDERVDFTDVVNPSRHPPLRRLGWILTCSVAIIVSLLTFPSSIPVMIGGWIAWHTISVCQGRAGLIPLATCGFIILVKRVGWPSSMVMMLVVIAVVCAARAWSFAAQGDGIKRPAILACLLLLWATWLGFAVEWFLASRTSRTPILSDSRPVVCMGDSLTAFGYPKHLEELLAIPVVDLGENGITSADGVKQLPQLVATNPQVVVIELGGHDYLRGHARAGTKANLTRIIATSQEIGAAVVLMEIPRGFVTDGYDGLERELAREMDLALISDTVIRELVLWSPHAPPGMWFDSDWHLSDDGLHPNELGNRHLAESVASALERLFRSEVVSRKPLRIEQ